MALSLAASLNLCLYLGWVRRREATPLQGTQGRRIGKCTEHRLPFHLILSYTCSSKSQLFWWFMVSPLSPWLIYPAASSAQSPFYLEHHLLFKTGTVFNSSPTELKCCFLREAFLHVLIWIRLPPFTVPCSFPFIALIIILYLPVLAYLSSFSLSKLWPPGGKKHVCLAQYCSPNK